MVDDSLEVARTLLADGCERGLVRALESRLTIGQAVGLLMARHRLDEEQARRSLADGAEQAQIPLREYAERLVESCNVELAPVDAHGWTIRPGAVTGGRARTAQVPQKVR